MIILMIIGLVCSKLWAQELPPIFKSTPKKIIEGRTLSSFPQKTFLESLVLLSNGEILVNSHYEGIVYKINREGGKVKFASINGRLVGIAAYGKDKFIVTGSDENETAAIYIINAKGTANKLLNIPNGQFLNGITPLGGNEFLVADSYKGCVWKVNALTKLATEWLTDDLLKRSSEQDPTPAANGIKIYDNTAYISNSQKKYCS